MIISFIMEPFLWPEENPSIRKALKKHTLRFLNRNYFGCLFSYDQIPNFYNACAVTNCCNVNIWYKAEGCNVYLRESEVILPTKVYLGFLLFLYFVKLIRYRGFRKRDIYAEEMLQKIPQSFEDKSIIAEYIVSRNIFSYRCQRT